MERAAAQGIVFQINISRGGAPKLSVPVATLGIEGLAGDYHDDVASHGGPTRAVCLFTLEEIERLAAEGNPIFAGAVGENVTLRGIPQELLTPGAALSIGTEIRLEITSYTTPCKGIAHAFSTADFTRISHKLHPGESRVYAKVLQGGEMRAGDPVSLWVADVQANETGEQAAAG
jgi:MOSC domain-containing protein YiiM